MGSEYTYAPFRGLGTRGGGGYGLSTPSSNMERRLMVRRIGRYEGRCGKCRKFNPR